MTGQIILLSGTSPNPPSLGKIAIYTKTDKAVYCQDDQGNEHSLAVNLIGAMSRWPNMTAPNGFAVCNGQLLSVSQYPELFAVLGDSHGGDGVTTFALPDLRSAGGYQTIMRVCDAAEAVAPTAVIVPCVIHGPMPDSYLAGDVLAFTVQLLDPVTVAGGPPKLSVTINSSTYLLDLLPGATTTEWHYQHTMTDADSGTLSVEIDLNGATLTTDTVPVTLNVAYLPNNKILVGGFLGVTMSPDTGGQSVTQVHSLSGAESTMSPDAESPPVTQMHLLSGAQATMTPTADTGVIV